MSFLENILTQLRSSGVVRSQRGPEGGYWLARPADEVNLADIIRAVEGPLVGVRGQPPEEIEYVGSAEALQQVWIALRANVRKVLENGTVADVAAGKLPKDVIALTRGEEVWHTRAEVAERAGPAARSSPPLRRQDPRDGKADRENLALPQLEFCALPRVTWAQMLRPSGSVSSTRTSKPRCTTRCTSASVVLESGSGRIWMSWGRTNASPRRLTGPTNDITNRCAALVQLGRSAGLLDPPGVHHDDMPAPRPSPPPGRE